MMHGAGIVQLRTVSERPAQAYDITVTPQSQALIVRLPFGGLVWRRPTAVLVERAGQTSRIPIVDVTRVIQLLLGVTTLVFWVAVRIRSSRRKEKRSWLTN
jgi:hypothetical protein